MCCGKLLFISMSFTCSSTVGDVNGSLSIVCLHHTCMHTRILGMYHGTKRTCGIDCILRKVQLHRCLDEVPGLLSNQFTSAAMLDTVVS